MRKHSPYSHWLRFNSDGTLGGIDGEILDELAKRVKINYSFQASRNYNYVGMEKAVTTWM